MTTIPTGLAINTAVSGDRTTAAGFRKVFSALFRQTAQGVPVAGILDGPGSPLNVGVNAGAMSYHVNAGFAVTTRSSGGAYLVGTDTALDITTSVGDATNPRIDLIYIVQPDPELSESGQARIDVQIGTASASPVSPTASLPAGALVLAQKTVPAGASNTSTGAALTNFATKTKLAMNMLYSATVAGLSSLAGFTTGDLAFVSSLQNYWRYNGSAWKQETDGTVASTSAIASNATSPTAGDRLWVTDQGVYYTYVTTASGAPSTGWYAELIPTGVQSHWDGDIVVDNLGVQPLYGVRFVTIPAAPFNRRVIFDFVGETGFSTAAGMVSGILLDNLVGLTATRSPASGDDTVACTSASTWYPYSLKKLFDLPLNTTGTFRLNVGSSGSGNIYMHGSFTVDAIRSENISYELN
jgi:hypothetical protein